MEKTKNILAVLWAVFLFGGMLFALLTNMEVIGLVVGFVGLILLIGTILENKEKARAYDEMISSDSKESDKDNK